MTPDLPAPSLSDIPVKARNGWYPWVEQKRRLEKEDEGWAAFSSFLFLGRAAFLQPWEFSLQHCMQFLCGLQEGVGELFYKTCHLNWDVFSLFRVYRGIPVEDFGARAHIPHCFDAVVFILLPLKVKIVNLKAQHWGKKDVVGWFCHNSKEIWGEGRERLIFFRQNLIEQKEMSFSDDDPRMCWAQTWG